MVVDRVLRFPTEHYGCRYGGYPGFNDVKVIFKAHFVILLSEFVSRIFFLSCEKRRQAIVSQDFI